MKEKKDSVQKLFSELPESMTLKELMEVKGGYPPPPVCPGDDSISKACYQSGIGVAG